MYWTVHWKYLINSQTIELFYCHQKYKCDLLKTGCYLLYYVYFLETSNGGQPTLAEIQKCTVGLLETVFEVLSFYLKTFLFQFHFSSVGAKMLSSLIHKQLKLNMVVWPVLLMSPSRFICKLSKENELWAHNESPVIVKATYMLEWNVDVNVECFT